MYTLVQRRLIKDSLISLSRAQPRNMLAAASSRAFASKFDDKEKGDEKVFFNKQDGKLNPEGRTRNLNSIYNS